MRLLVVLGLASIAAGLLLASASAGPPAPMLLHIGVTHEQPRAGHLFTGLIFTPAGGARITEVVCDAKVGQKELRGRQQRFYEEGGPTVVTCGWRIPTGAGGKRLHLSGNGGTAVVFLEGPGTTQTTYGTPVLFWRVQP